MSKQVLPQPGLRPSRFLPPDVDAKVNENLLRFGSNFESFRVKSNEYVNHPRDKGGSAIQPAEIPKGQSERLPKVEVRGSQKMSVNSPPQPPMPLHAPFEPVNNFNPRPVAPNPFEKSVSPLPPASLKSAHGASIGANFLAPPVPVPTPYPHGPSSLAPFPPTTPPLQIQPQPHPQGHPPTPQSVSHMLTHLRQITIPLNGPFDPQELFHQFDAQYRSHTPVDTLLPASFDRCSPNRKARIFLQVSQLASEVTDAQIEPFLIFVSAFENDFLLLSVLSRLFKRPGLALSDHWVNDIGTRLVRLHRSRRLQLLLINFINKLD